MDISLNIIIVNWNSQGYLRKCLRSITDANKNEIVLRVIIIDNASTDNSLKDLPTSLNLNIIKNSKNIGFAAACNKAWRMSKSQFVLFLNPDTEVYRDTLRESVIFMQKNRHIAVLGCRHVNNNDQTLPSCSRFPGLANYVYDVFGLTKISPKFFLSPTLMLEWDHKESREVDQVMGAFMLIRNQILVKVEGMDERFFIYYEDMDLSQRIKKEGGITYYNADIKINHKGGGISQNVQSKRLSYSLHSRILYGYKYFSASKALLLKLLTLFVEPLTRMFYSLIRGNPKSIREIIIGYFYLYQRRMGK